jgi:preprotein translocase subunit SecA
MDAFKIPDDQPIQNKMISSAIEKAQARIEGYNFDIRNHVLEYDEVMNKQRTAIYNMRKQILFNSDEELENKIKELMDEKEYGQYTEKIKEINKKDIANIEKFVILRTIDNIWMEHIETMEYLRDSVKLRAYGQRDPLVEYKNESRRLFDQILQDIDNGIVEVLLKAEFKEQPAIQPRPVMRPIQPKNKTGEVGRNDPCPCGSGKKYKRCCGA